MPKLPSGKVVKKARMVPSDHENAPTCVIHEGETMKLLTKHYRKGPKGVIRMRRFLCMVPGCGYSLMVHANGERDLHHAPEDAIKAALKEQNRIIKNDRKFLLTRPK